MKTARRTALVAAALNLGLVGGTVAVSADTPVSPDQGVYGRHSLADDADHPGVSCFYDGDQVLERIRVKAPIVFAADTTGGSDEALVGWRYIVQRSGRMGDPSGWTTIRRSDARILTATDAQPAAFTARSWSFRASAGRSYRVVIRMLWYGDSVDVIRGRATHLVDWYVGAAFRPSFGPGGYCPGGVL